MSGEHPTLHVIEEPFDAYENQLVEQIRTLKEQYEQAAAPLIAALARSRAAKPSGWVMVLHSE